MIDKITISIHNQYGIEFIMALNTLDTNNLECDLAVMFEEVINKIDAKFDKVIDYLTEEHEDRN